MANGRRGAGALDRLITIEHPVMIQNEYGEEEKQWQEFYELPHVWAEKVDLNGRELYEAQQLNSEVTTQFRLRYRADLDARMRVACDDVLYSVKAVLEGDGRRRWTLLMCARSVN